MNTFFFLNLIKWEWRKLSFGGNSILVVFLWKNSFLPWEKNHARPIFPVLKEIIISRVDLIAGEKTMQRDGVFYNISLHEDSDKLAHNPLRRWVCVILKLCRDRKESRRRHLTAEVRSIWNICWFSRWFLYLISKQLYCFEFLLVSPSTFFLSWFKRSEFFGTKNWSFH